MDTTVTDQQLDALGGYSAASRAICDQQTLERARRVAAESGQRLDAVLIQLGLVSERGLAEAYADLLGVAGCHARPLLRRRSRCCPTG